ncbi:serine/threonine protein kinase [Streptomyces alboflavus]|uniref:non-specific serine/threonine protein kinase n=1 Tax=Streptomyces alboflavus TaxID=67267 RepID=A0A1Z1WHK8_9ACTN|nr:serine/threonine-protein kinase [Streptomyces alboflavus]ARX85868.1 serine/threonine protein kinase [Streptomyces alboflavus]
MTRGHRAVPTGYRVGSWEVREPLGTGAFSSVYAARRATGAVTTPPGPGAAGPGTGPLPARAALKFLPTAHTPRGVRQLRELAEREITLLSRLRSPRLIRMYEVLTVDDPARPDLDGATVLVLEEAEQSLAGLLERSPVPRRGPALLAQVCEGLHQLHRAGWVHGDLKPANVLVLKDGSVRLADFQTAAELEGTHAYSAAFSTPDHTPPELLWPDVSERGTRIRPTADLWAFGVLAHVVLTDSYPLPGGTPATRRDAAIRYARGAEELRLSPALPPQWRDIVARCLARTHQERPPLATAALLRRVERAARVPRSPRLRGLPRPRTPRARRTAWAAGALALALTAAGVVYGNWPVAYGYHRCPAGSVCFFSERDGNGDMCSWRGDDTDWLAGGRTCRWTEARPVKSVFNNDQESKANHDVAYWRGPDFVPTGYDRERETKRTGCTSVNQQGNLEGTYTPRSHRWVPHC